MFSFLVECLGFRSHQSFGENSLVSKAALHTEQLCILIIYLSGLVMNCLFKLGIGRSLLVECLGSRNHQSFGENSLVSKAALCTAQ